jgi:hypothetical protein
VKAKAAVAAAKRYTAPTPVSPPSWQEKAKELRQHFGKDLLTQGEIAEYLGCNHTGKTFRKIIALVPGIGEGKGKRYPVDCFAKAYTAMMS